MIARLRQVRLSKHLVLIRALHDAVPPGGRNHLQAGLDLLSRVRRTRPDLVADVLGHPHVGAWAARTLRAVSGTEVPAPALLARIGYLAAAGATAAIRAGLAFEVAVPVVDGAVQLPSLGRAVVGDGSGSSVPVRGNGRQIAVDGRTLPSDLTAEEPGWQPVRRLRAESAGVGLTVELDDLDIHRGRHGCVAAHRLDEAAVAGWQHRFADAWDLLVRHHRRQAEAISRWLVTLVPLRAGRQTHGMSATSTDAFGAVLLALPSGGRPLALTLVHEFQHGKLSVLLDLVRLHDGDPTPRYYAPWRDDPRPLGGLLHGAYAFLAVTDFWRVERALPGGGGFADMEFARWRDGVRAAIHMLGGSGQLTEAGARFVQGMYRRMAGWHDLVVPEEARLLARDAADDHRTAWRVRHQLPDDRSVGRYVRAWRAAEPPPASGGGPAVVAGPPAGPGGNVRLELAGLRLQQPARFAELVADPALRERVAPAATAADVALAAGDYHAAVAAYRAGIAARPTDAGQWAGLAVALRRCGRTAASTALLRQPELVAAVHRALAADGDPPEPDRLATWFAVG